MVDAKEVKEICPYLSDEVIGVSRGIILVVVGILIFPPIFDVNGSWMASPFAELITMLFFWGIMVYYGKKKG